MTMLHVQILEAIGHPMPRGADVLDLGCGEGATITALHERGYRALGCDIERPSTERGKVLESAGIIRLIHRQPYRLPFDSASFDFVLSHQVFEHVMNLYETLAELRRVLRPDGTSLHVFPSRWCLIEPHAYVPFATVLRSKRWLLLWAALGIRNEYQRGLSAWETARMNREYLIAHTTYPPPSEIRRRWSRHFREVRWVEEVALALSPRPAGRLAYPIGRVFPGVFQIYRRTRANCLLAR